MQEDTSVTSEPNDPLLTPEEAAQRLRVTLASIYKRVQQREISYVRFGRLLRFRKSTIEDFIRRCEEGK